MKTIYKLTGIILIFCSCNNISNKEVLGTYVAFNFKNTSDTIYLGANNIYQRKVCDKKGKVSLEMKGKFKYLQADLVEFSSFFLNLDRDIQKYPELLNDTFGSYQVELKKANGKISFCLDYYPDVENCYRKVE